MFEFTALRIWTVALNWIWASGIFQAPLVWCWYFRAILDCRVALCNIVESTKASSRPQGPFNAAVFKLAPNLEDGNPLFHIRIFQSRSDIKMWENLRTRDGHLWLRLKCESANARDSLAVGDVELWSSCPLGDRRRWEGSVRGRRGAWSAGTLFATERKNSSD